MPRNSSIMLETHDSRFDGSTRALLSSLVLLAVSFTLLVLGPGLLARFHGSADALPAGSYLKVAAASGIALGGGAAMMAVIARLVREIERHPYAALAPVLTVFAGFLLWGLHPELPIPGLRPEATGIFALAASAGGGALISRSHRLGGRLAGWVFTLFAPLSLVGLLWAHAKTPGLQNAIAGLSTSAQMVLGLLLAASLLLGVLGEAGRAVARRHPAPDLDDQGTFDAPIELSRRAGQSAAPRAPRLFGESTPHHPDPCASQPFVGNASYTPQVSVWDFEDERVVLPTGGGIFKIALALILVLGGGAAAFYYGVYLPGRERERAALEANEQRRAALLEAQEREAAAQRDADQRAEAERLKKLVEQVDKKAVGGPALQGAVSDDDALSPDLEGASAIAPVDADDETLLE